MRLAEEPGWIGMSDVDWENDKLPAANEGSTRAKKQPPYNR